jgi:leader peptidase (prepilin peptidase)/N-methyltransferase
MTATPLTPPCRLPYSPVPVERLRWPEIASLRGPMNWFVDGAMFVFGAVVGSFLNVCIYRMPREDMSIKRPRRSVCFSCGGQIHWYDNLPIVSYIVLRGRCRSCGAAFSVRYPLVELLTAVLFLLIWRRFGVDVATPIYLVFTSALIVASFIDIDHFIIPDEISLPGIGIALVLGILLPVIRPDSAFLPDTSGDAILGGIIGGGSLWSIGAIAKAILRREAMGFGDVKLLTMVGLLVGWKITILTIVFSAFIGVLISLPIHLFQRKGRYAHLPYGPYLSLAAVLCLFWDKQKLWEFYVYSPGYVADWLAQLFSKLF